NAGFGDYGFPWDVNLEKANDMINLNIKALTDLSLLYVKDYADKDSTLINTASIGGYAQFDIAVTYCATKFYVASFTEGLALAMQS
ncbi:SDR family NAD(P)-dependent oxidoreductase, partial [Acinetobacter baumannii]